MIDAQQGPGKALAGGALTYRRQRLDPQAFFDGDDSGQIIGAARMRFEQVPQVGTVEQA